MMFCFSQYRPRGRNAACGCEGVLTTLVRLLKFGLLWGQVADVAVDLVKEHTISFEYSGYGAVRTERRP